MADQQEEKLDKNQEEQKPKKSKKLLLIVGVVVLLLVGAGAYFFLFSGSDTPQTSESNEGTEGTEAVEAPSSQPEGEAKAAAEDASSKEQKPAGEESKSLLDKIKGSKPAEFGDTINLKPFNINLGNPLENRYVRLEVALEYKGKDSQRQEIEKRMPQLRDAIISVTGKKSREFLLSPEGKDQLRKELLIVINRYMSRPIEAVYITDILID